MDNDNIYIPRSCVPQLETYKSVVVKIPYGDYEISLALDSSCGNGDLFRGDFRVWHNDRQESKDELTKVWFLEADVIVGNADQLKRIFAKIDELTVLHRNFV